MPLFSKLIAEPVLQNLAFDPPRPDMTLADLSFTTETLDALGARHPLFDATNPDLGAFRDSGGKLILWHGLADPHIAPATTVAYYRALQEVMGPEAVADFARLYLLPGVGHCGGGRGPAELDLLTAMMTWVESGVAPHRIETATKTETASSRFGQPDGVEDRGNRPPQRALGVPPLPAMTRPVFPWPLTAAFTGAGDVNDTASWAEGPALETVAVRDWAGADFFAPVRPQD
jgi:feruloyl esterase